MGKQTIIRTAHDGSNRYFLMSRKTAQDKTLTFAARGMLAYLLSKPNDWKITVPDLCQECRQDKVYSILAELRKSGYIKHLIHRDPKTKRITSREYIVYEEPVTEKPDREFPDKALPDKEKPDGIHNTENTQNTERTEYSFASGDAESGENVQPLPVAAEPPKQPDKPQGKTTGKFTKGKFYPVCDEKQIIYAKTYTPKTYTPLLEEWAKHGIKPIQGNTLNSDPRYASYAVTKPPAKRNPTFDAFAECAFGMAPGFDKDVLNGDSGRVGLLISKLAELLGRTFNDINDDKSIAVKVRAVYGDFKSKHPGAHVPRDPIAFIGAWNDYALPQRKAVTAQTAHQTPEQPPEQRAKIAQRMREAREAGLFKS